EVVGPDLFAALARADLGAALLRALRVDALLLEVEQARAQDGQRLGLVLELRLLVLTLHDEARRQMRDAHGRVRRVDALAARPARAHDVDAQILVPDLDVDLFGLGHHGDRHGRGVDAALALGRGHALDAVDALLVLEPAEDV